MDLNTIESVLRPALRAGLPDPLPGDAPLAGGTWLFSEPQPGLRRLIDLNGLGWPDHDITADGLRLSATCTIAALSRLELPGAWRASALMRPCCEALLGSFKIWNAATIGGNICLALPAGPMTALAVAMDAVAEIWMPEGGSRHLRVRDLVTAPGTNALAAGEILRAIDLPAEALGRRSAMRRIALSPNGRSGALLIGTLAASGAFALTVTAATRRPVQLAFEGLPEPKALAARLAAIPDGLIYDDVHGRPDWRRHVTGLLAREIRDELAGDTA